MKKKITLSLIWIAFIGCLALNMNLGLLLGSLSGIILRLYSGKVVAYTLGLTIGIMLVELTKFVTYKF